MITGGVSPPGNAVFSYGYVTFTAQLAVAVLSRVNAAGSSPLIAVPSRTNCGAEGSIVGGGGTIVGPAPASITLTKPPPGVEMPMFELGLPPPRPASALVPAPPGIDRAVLAGSPEHAPQTASQPNAH